MVTVTGGGASQGKIGCWCFWLQHQLRHAFQGAARESVALGPRSSLFAWPCLFALLRRVSTWWRIKSIGGSDWNTYLDLFLRDKKPLKFTGTKLKWLNFWTFLNMLWFLKAAVHAWKQCPWPAKDDLMGEIHPIQAVKAESVAHGSCYMHWRLAVCAWSSKSFHICFIIITKNIRI